MKSDASMNKGTQFKYRWTECMAWWIERQDKSSGGVHLAFQILFERSHFTYETERPK